VCLSISIFLNFPHNSRNPVKFRVARSTLWQLLPDGSEWFSGPNSICCRWKGVSEWTKAWNWIGVARCGWCRRNLVLVWRAVFPISRSKFQERRVTLVDLCPVSKSAHVVVPVLVLSPVVVLLVVNVSSCSTPCYCCQSPPELSFPLPLPQPFLLLGFQFWLDHGKSDTSPPPRLLCFLR